MKIGIILLASMIGLVVATDRVGADPEKFTLDHRDISVVDGDTIMVGTKVFELFGIDAPELGQQCLHNNEPWPCGRNAALLLHKIVTLDTGVFQCETIAASGDHTRISCAEGTRDVALSLLAEGAVATSSEAPFGYRIAEAAAQRANLGIWRDAFQSPAEWRAAMATVGAQGRKADECPFVGQVRDGAKVVLISPVGGTTEPTKIIQGDEHSFCSDDEAIDAGWQLRLRDADN